MHRFHREVQAAARLSHPNIVAAHDADEAKGIHYLVMEHVEGEDLATLVRRSGAQPIGTAVNLMIQAARGLEYAHSQGVVHRDIKPSNLLLDKRGTVKILDMGLARIDGPGGEGSGGGTLTSTGMVMGTIDYMSPEQALDTKHAGPPSDIYSLGCTLFFLATGRAPFEGDTVMKKLLAHREAAIPALGEAIPATGNTTGERLESLGRIAAVDEVLQRMLAKNPRNRYASMGDVIRALEATAVAQGATAVSRGLSTESGPAVALAGDSGVADFAVTPSKPSPFKPAAEVDTTPSSAFEGTLANLAADLKRPRPGTKSTGSTRPPSGTIAKGPKASKPGRSWLKPPRVYGIAAAAVAVVALLAGLLLRVETPAGTIVLKIDQPELAGAEVTVDGEQKITIKAKGDSEPIVVAADAKEHTLRVAKGGFETFTTKFTVKSGEATPIEVWLEPADSETDGRPLLAQATRPFAQEGERAGDSATVLLPNDRRMEFVWCPSGTFQMGDLAGGVQQVQSVTLSRGFWLGRTEVTQGQWRAVMGTSPWLFHGDRNHLREGDDFPATYVSHGLSAGDQVELDSATEFCRKLTMLEHRAGRIALDWEFRLPTEAEWEYSCRAGTISAFSIGEGGALLGDHAWFVENANDAGEAFAHAVGTKRPNPWGLFDLHGNIWEWCSDWFEEGPARGWQPVDPSGPATGTKRAHRGGAWNVLPAEVRSANRNGSPPTHRSSDLGFRVTLSRVFVGGQALRQSGSGLKVTTDGLRLPVVPTETGSALEFAAANAYAELPVPFVGTGDLTIEAWATPAGMGADNRIVLGCEAVRLKQEPVKDGASRFSGVFTLLAENGVKDNFMRATKGPLSIGETVHLALVRQSGQLRMYLNGREDSLVAQFKTVAQEPGQPSDLKDANFAVSTTNWRVGGMPGRQFIGVVDEVRISDVARYDGDFTPLARFEPDPNTLGLYHFDEGSGDVVKDASGRGRDGILINAKWVLSRGPKSGDVSEANSLATGDWIPLFDGSDTSRWKTLGKFEVVDGLLTTSAKTLAVSQPEFDDFELEFEWKIGPGANSGVYYRTPASNFSQVIGGSNVEYAIADPTEKNLTVATGSFWSTVPATALAEKPVGEFNTGRIVCRGPLVEHWLNGQEVVSYDEAAPGFVESFPNVKIRDNWRKGHGRGPICLQGNLGTVSFQSVRIRELKRDSRNATAASSNGSLQFDGVDDSVELPTLKLDPSKPFTIEAIVTPAKDKPLPDGDPGPDGDPLFATNTPVGGTSKGLAITLNRNGSSWWAGRLLDAPASFESTYRIAPDLLGRTYQVAVVCDGTRTQLFFDGRKVASGEMGPAPASDPKAQPVPPFVPTIGWTYNGTIQRHRHFKGVIDELRISTVARYTADFTPEERFEPDSNTLALFHFDEGAGDALKDASGNGNDGKIVGATWLSSGGAAAAADAALSLDGRASCVVIPSLTTAPLSPVTIEATVVPEQDSFVVAKIDPQRAGLWRWQKGWYFGVVSNGTTMCAVDDSPLVPGRAVQVAGVWDGTRPRLFVNGREAPGRESIRSPARILSALTMLGAQIRQADQTDPSKYEPELYLRGRLDEVRISGIARYDGDYTPARRLEADAGTLALYHCDEGVGDVVKDSSGNGHDGTIIGATWVRAASVEGDAADARP